MDNLYKCGVYDTSTGTFQEGETNNDGKMEFNPLTWWQKLFSRPEIITECIGSDAVCHRDGSESPCVIYRTHRLCCNITDTLYALYYRRGKSRRVEFDPKLYDHNKQFVIIDQK
jgi:hypothetical protein